MKSKKPLFILIAGYIFSSLGYLIWYHKIWRNSPYHKNVAHAFNMEIVGVIICITACFLLLYFIILHIRSFRTPRKSFVLVSIITLFILFLIPSVYHAKYHFLKAKEKIRHEKKYMKELKARLGEAIVKNQAAEQYIIELQAKLESKNKENDELSKQLNKTIRKNNLLEKKYNTKEDMLVQAKSHKVSSKIKKMSELINTDSDKNNQEIIFKVQIISSGTRLASNSPKFKGIKNVWEYKDGDLYKYTIGNQKDLKSASKLQAEFRKKGFTGAFVLSFKDGKRIPVKEALKLLN